MEQADKYFKLRQQKDEAEAVLAQVKEELGQVEKDLVLYMENENLQSFKDATFGTIYLREQVYARIDDEGKAFDWFRTHDLGDLIKATIHNKSLVAVAKENPEIPGVVTAYETKVGYRKGA